MSLPDCLSKGPENCQAPCVLEYQADTDDGNPTCVLPVRDVATLREEDVVAVKRILLRLLPQAEVERLVRAFRILHPHLYAYMNTKLRSEFLLMNHESWLESCKRLAVHIHNEINESICFACYGDLNDRNSREEIHVMACCSNIAHLRCIQEAGRVRPECPWCNNFIGHLVPGDLPPDPRLQPGMDNDEKVAIFVAVVCAIVVALLFMDEMLANRQSPFGP